MNSVCLALPDPPSIFLSPIFRNGRGAEGLGTRLAVHMVAARLGFEKAMVGTR